MVERAKAGSVSPAVTSAARTRFSAASSGTMSARSIGEQARPKDANASPGGRTVKSSCTEFLRTIPLVLGVERGDSAQPSELRSSFPRSYPRSSPILTLPNPSQSFDAHLSSLGLGGVGTVYRNQSTALLYEHALARHEGMLGAHGQLVVETGKHTGRSPNDKFF